MCDPQHRDVAVRDLVDDDEIAHRKAPQAGIKVVAGPADARVLRQQPEPFSDRLDQSVRRAFIACLAGDMVPDCVEVVARPGREAIGSYQGSQSATLGMSLFSRAAAHQPGAHTETR